ncbi:MAG: hypothetical protein WCR70_09405 [Sphaerochaetaceae bacterium]
MDWGLLQGLGEGLTSVGKSLLAKQLEIEREKRAEERERAREERRAEREASTVASYKPEIDNQGNVWMRAYNSAGEPLDKRRPASVTEIEDFQRQRETNRLSLEKLVADTTTAKFNADRLPTKAAQDDEMFGVRKRQIEASTAASLALANQRNSGKDEEVKTERDYIDYVLDKGKAIANQYIGTAVSPGPLTASEVDDIAGRAARLGVAEGRDPINIFKKMLEEAAALKKPGKVKEGEQPRVRFMGDY